MNISIVSVFLAFFSLFTLNAFARDTVVRGYIKKNGTYVEGYHRTTPNNTRDDNYSTRGNINPYTGKPGTVRSNEGIGSEPLKFRRFDDTYKSE